MVEVREEEERDASIERCNVPAALHHVTVIR